MPAPKQRFETGEFKRFTRLVAQSAPMDDLEARRKRTYYEKLMVAGARHDRNGITLHRPTLSPAKYMIIRSAARADFRRGVRVAERLQACRYLARGHLQVDFGAQSVSITGPGAFAELPNNLHSEVARK